jgi:hypothetical protein
MKIRVIFCLAVITSTSTCFAGPAEKARLHELVPNMNFHGTRETLERIKQIVSNKEKGAYLRFGDGDIVLAYGEQDMMQAPSEKLSREMKEAFSLNGKNILKTLPIHCREIGTSEPGMFTGNHEWDFNSCMRLLTRITPLWNDDVTDVYSMVSLHHLACVDAKYCIDFLKFLKNSNCFLFIGNENVPDHIKGLLWGSSCKHIKTPSRNAFNAMDRIEQQCYESMQNDGTYKIVVIAMGCSGRVLAKRLWSRFDNVFFFDFGSLLDALCGWNTRDWISLSHFNANKFLNMLATA